MRCKPHFLHLKTTKAFLDSLLCLYKTLPRNSMCANGSSRSRNLRTAGASTSIATFHHTLLGFSSISPQHCVILFFPDVKNWGQWLWRGIGADLECWQLFVFMHVIIIVMPGITWVEGKHWKHKDKWFHWNSILQIAAGERLWFWGWGLVGEFILEDGQV